MNNSKLDNLIANAEYFARELAELRREATDISRSAESAGDKSTETKTDVIRRNLLEAEKLMEEISLCRVELDTECDFCDEESDNCQC